MFINHPATILFVSISILAICTGVFGYMSLFGVTLDPIVMSISIMCVGFSVDIPAHVSFHFHASRTHVMKRSTCSTLASNGGEVSSPGKVDETYFKSRKTRRNDQKIGDNKSIRPHDGNHRMPAEADNRSEIAH
ncbi:hypothetical protein COOONC_12267 [Cooperia oncophora]